MSVIIKCAGYMALVYEGSAAFLIMVQMVQFSRIMKFDMVDVMILLGEMFKALLFGVLAVGIISRYRLMLKFWLIMSYLQIKWGAVGELFITFYEYLFTDKFRSKDDLMRKLSITHAPIIGQVLSRIGIILMVYRFYRSLEPPKTKLKIQLGQKAAEMKAK